MSTHSNNRLDQDVVREIERCMNWNGMPPHPPLPRPEPNCHNVLPWTREMYKWGLNVRRDILVLEYHVANLTGKLRRELFYGDPGDPPPPPDEI